MIILGLLQIATIYSTTFQQFLAVRSLFGLFMGGVYGNAIAMALEHCPTNARGLMSGILQQGYSFGYVLAACANLGVGGETNTWKTVFWIAAGFSIAVGLIRVAFPESHQFLEAKARGAKSHTTNARGLMSGILQQGYSFGYVLAACANLGVGGETDTWKTVFWIAAGFSIAVGLVRVAFPESQQFLEAKASGAKSHTSAGDFWRATRAMIRAEWRMCIYCIILMTWFNYYSHTSQDSYTTFMLTQKQLDNAAASRASILMKTGACVGGTIIGYLSQFFGRRRAIIASALISACLIPAWILPHGERSLSASGFFMQFFVQGAWGVIPIHLNELSPPAFRSSFPGICYQLGNAISSPSAQIVNAIAENTLITIQGKNGPTKVEAFGPTMGIATAIIAMGIVCTTMLGPEKRGRSFENAVAGVQTDDHLEQKVADIEKDEEAGVESKEESRVETAR
ncbi:Carboxylic acid transporter protein like [Verticillium longisporum]|nr:Carboxylic acid transporter protein like [Verticillium longisporum]